MSAPFSLAGTASPKAEPKLDRALSEQENQHWCLLGHSVFVVALLALVVVPFSIPSVRLGGGEFPVLLPECTMEQLELVFRRLGVLEVDWQGQKIPVTFSAGWNQYQPGESPQEMLTRADEILYARKRASKKVQAATKGQGKAAPATHLHVEATRVLCAHCKGSWEPVIPGPVMVGPFPK